MTNENIFSLQKLSRPDLAPALNMFKSRLDKF